jgi:FtsP/CotA-like multicopper oxidase with cupredoxin domain
MQIATPKGCGPAYEEGEFYDTISAPGDCTVRFRTADIGQRCVLHCHVLYHEDNGSMSWVNVTGDGMPMNNVQSPSYSCPDITSLVNNE